jgi:hypothetical protein
MSAARTFAGLPIPVDCWAGIIARATVYPTRCGRRPVFHTLADAEAYTRGFHQPHAEYEPGTPAARGAADALEQQP